MHRSTQVTWQVPRRVYEGERCDMPPGCPKELFNLLLSTWLKAPEDRPTFALLRFGLAPFRTFSHIHFCPLSPRIVTDSIILYLESFNMSVDMVRDEFARILESHLPAEWRDIGAMLQATKYSSCPNAHVEQPVFPYA